MRVLHVFAPGYNSRFGGPIYAWKYYFLNWNESKVKHYVLDSDIHQVVDAKLAFCFEYSGIQQRTSRWKRAVWIFTLLIDLIRYRSKYDLLHIHVLWWGTLLLGPLGKLTHIPTLYESVLLNEDTPGGILKERFGKLQVRCLRSYRAIRAISNSLADDYLRFGFSSRQVHTLMNCLDTELFSPLKLGQERSTTRKRLGVPEDATLLLFIGSVIERKGVDILVRAFIASSIANPGLYLLIVGPRNKNENPSLDEDFVHSLQVDLNKNNLTGQVRFLGLIQNRQELAELYRAAHMFVFPSRNEGLPGVVLEAMSAGLPVIASQLPGLANVMRHGENGILVPIADVPALQEAILLLSANPPLAARIGSNAREYIMKHHSFGSWQTHLTELYEHLLS